MICLWKRTQQAVHGLLSEFSSFVTSFPNLFIINFWCFWSKIEEKSNDLAFMMTVDSYFGDYGELDLVFLVECVGNLDLQVVGAVRVRAGRVQVDWLGSVGLRVRVRVENIIHHIAALCLLTALQINNNKKRIRTRNNLSIWREYKTVVVSYLKNACKLLCIW